MSEYQYYEFQAIDRLLGEDDRAALRNLSSRARITSTTFTNNYQWGDFGGNPVAMMERWFDLHLYWANWGTRRLMMRLPARLVDRGRLGDFLLDVDGVTIKTSGNNLILSIVSDDEESSDYDFSYHDETDDDCSWLAALAPLRADLLAGDLRLFYLVWLTAVQGDVFEVDVLEPLAGIGPMTEALNAFARFFRVDQDLIAAAAERPFGSPLEGMSSREAIRRLVSGWPDGEKTDLLVRLFEGDLHVASELRALARTRLAAAAPAMTEPLRTVGDLRARAEAIRDARERAEGEREAAERRRLAAEQERARRARLDAVRRRGESVWREIEGEIDRRNAGSYDRAAALLFDLQVIAQEDGTLPAFSRAIAAIRARHGAKSRFIERVVTIG